VKAQQLIKFMIMKKIFLTFGLIFASIFMINANSTIENQKTNTVLNRTGCYEAADKSARDLGNCMNITFEQEYNYFVLIYDACMKG